MTKKNTVLEFGKVTRNPLNAADSMFQRWSANASSKFKKGKGNKQQASGADIQKKMDFETEKPRSVYDKQPLSFMDTVLNIWSKGKKVK